MKQEDKELLLKDLCSRLPYGVKIQCINSDNETVIEELFTIGIEEDSFDCNMIEYVSVKPYLFPLSSMTEEQEKEFKNLYYRFHESAFFFNERFSYDRHSIKDIGFYPCYLQDWLLKNHFDIYGLIPKGLANNATGLNIY